MNFKNKKVLIIGLKRSGQAVCNLLKKKKANIFLYDENITVLEQVKQNNIDCVALHSLDEEFIKNIDYLVISPSVSIYSEVVKLANLYNKTVLSELSVGLNFAKGKKILVTGTNGKTTTVNLIEQMLNYAKKRNSLVGNVGNPICDNISRFACNYVVEVSSFQLESSPVFPDIACILNISENHLDRHYTMNNYILAKYRIFENMTKNKTLILNYDDEFLKKLESGKTNILEKQVNVNAKVMWFSTKQKVQGAYLCDGKIFFNHNGKTEEICKTTDIKLLGKHNIENVLASICVCKVLKVKTKHIVSAIKNFCGVENRLQVVDEINDIFFVNDSKSTTPKSTLTAVDSIQKPIILILGGSDKNIDYDDFAIKIKDKFKYAVLMGEIRNKIAKSFKKANIESYQVEKDFYKAVKLAISKAEKGDCVLLSPSTASFDQFSCFEQRGEAFCKIVRSIRK